MRFYITKFVDVSVSVAAQDLFEILAPTGTILKVWEWEIGQNSDFGDSQEEGLRLEEVRGRGTVASGSGGSTHVPQPLDRGLGVSNVVVETNNTTRMAVGTGTLDELASYIWNVRVPYQKIYMPELRPVIASGDRWTLSVDDIPTDPLIVSGYVVFEKIG